MAVAAQMDPNVRTQYLQYAAMRILDMCDRLNDQHTKVIAAHQRGDITSAHMHRGLRDEYDVMLARFHHQTVLRLGRTAVDQALTTERRRRRAAKAGA